MIKLKSLIEELFERPSMLFNNPNYDDRLWYEVMEDFKKDGGTIVGQGKYATVLFHPGWNYVLKVFSRDDCYLKFIRFVMKNRRPSFPQIFDKPRKIVPHFKRTKETQFLYVIPIEKLTPITEIEWSDIRFYLRYGPSDQYDHSAWKEMMRASDFWSEAKIRADKIEHKYPKIKQLKDDYTFFEDFGLEGSPDFHSKNFMKRDNGEFVISDPLWEGETPYQAHDRAMKMEMDYYGDDRNEKEPEYIKGGKKYKTPKIKKSISPTPTYQADKEEVPF